MKGVKQSRPRIFSKARKRGSSTDDRKVAPLDPLFVIFEKHLFNFQDSDLDRKAFIDLVLRDYVRFLAKKNLSIPKEMYVAAMEELSNQINTMLVKKIYGCFSIQEYQEGLPTDLKRQARVRYAKLKS